MTGPVSRELPGQLPFWDDDEPWMTCDDPCDECGTYCTSSKECVRISGLYDEEDEHAAP